jgi:hypothetical protein
MANEPANYFALVGELLGCSIICLQIEEFLCPTNSIGATPSDLAREHHGVGLFYTSTSAGWGFVVDKKEEQQQKEAALAASASARLEELCSSELQRGGEAPALQCEELLAGVLSSAEQSSSALLSALAQALGSRGAKVGGTGRERAGRLLAVLEHRRVGGEGAQLPKGLRK